MLYLLDTNTVSDLMRRRPTVREHLSALRSSDRVAVCPIVRGEILYGIERMPVGQRRAQLEERAESAFAEVPCEATPVTAGDRYAEMKVTREREGLVLDENDLWIAATARALGAVLVTNDRDFGRVDGLSVQSWVT